MTKVNESQLFFVGESFILDVVVVLVTPLDINCEYMRRFARFGTTCTILENEEHPWWSVTFTPATLLKAALLHGCFSLF